MVYHEVLDSLSLLEEDISIPKNIRVKVKDARGILERCDAKTQCVAVDQVLHELEDLAGDPNVSVYIRQQLWGLMSNLERLNQRTNGSFKHL